MAGDDGAGVGAGAEVVVERLVAGGEALARVDGAVVLVSGALPGERVRLGPVARRRGAARADVAEVLAPSPARVAPPCPHVADGCGGCDLQHARAADQPAMKVAVVVDALRRLGGVADPPVVAGPALPSTGFRSTVRAAVGAGGRAGFRRLRSHEVVAVGSCLVAHPLVEEVLVDGRFPGAEEVTLRAGVATGERLALVAPTAVGAVVPDDVVVVGADELAQGRRAWIHDVVAGRRWRISAGSFFQSRVDGAAALVDAVRAAAGSVLAPGARVVDAYAGVGLLAGALTVGWDEGATVGVQLVERSASSVADARVNLAGTGARVVRADVARWRPSPADLVVADPARAGLAAAAAERLVRAGPEVLVLVSCDAAALGRDAGLLAGHGYRLVQATLVDLFPHTHHVEVVSRFERT